MRIFGEHSGFEVVATFREEDGTPALPSSVHWRVRCVTNDQTLIDWTVASVETLSDETGITGYRVQIDVPGSANTIIDRSNLRETKEVEIVAAKDQPNESGEVEQYYVTRRGAR